MNFGSGGNSKAKAWRDIWGCGQGIGAVKDMPTAGELVARLSAEYEEAKAELAAEDLVHRGRVLLAAEARPDRGLYLSAFLRAARASA